jgi:hypothetical protein
MASSVALLRHIDDLLLGALGLARARKAQLLAISVEVPSAEIQTVLSERLALLGHPAVEVRSTFVAGPVRLLTVEYSR